MTDSLFRQQAIEHQSERLYGEVVLTQPLSLSLLTYGIVLVIVGIALFLSLGSYARRETVAGYLMPDKGLAKVYAPLSGVLSEVHVNEDSRIDKGELLFTVVTRHINEQGGDRDALLLQELAEQKAGLEDKMAQELRLHEVQMASLTQKIGGIERELQQLQSALTTQKQQFSSTRSMADKMNELYQKGHVSETQYQQQQQELLTQKAQLQSMQRQNIQLQNQLAELKNQQQELPLRWQSRSADFQSSLSDIEQRRVEVSGRRTYSIRAPVSGRIAALQVTEGQMLTPQSLLVAILPEGSTLQAELFLPTRAAGFVKEGQPVYLRYAAFPYQHYGLYDGTVSHVAQVILAPNELPIPVSLNEPVYRIKVTLDEQTVNAYGKQFSLQAGMLLDADIVLEERSLAEWLLEPVLGLRGRL